MAEFHLEGHWIKPAGGRSKGVPFFLMLVETRNESLPVPYVIFCTFIFIFLRFCNVTLQFIPLPSILFLNFKRHSNMALRMIGVFNAQNTGIVGSQCNII